MRDDTPPKESTPADPSQEELEALVRGIDRREIVELVKNTRYLRQHVFSGYRPHRLPWNLVPTRLANDVRGNPEGVEILTGMWVRSNMELLQEVETLELENLDDGVAELLAEHGVGHRFQILWALRLDDREEVVSALEAGLEEELIDETSSLLSRVQVGGLTKALDKAHQRADALQEELDATNQRLSDLQELVRHKSQQLEQSQVARSDWETRHNVAQERVAELEESLERAGAANTALQRDKDEQDSLLKELRRSVADLKESLRAQAESFRESDVQHSLDQALLKLEEERREASSLRLKLSKVETQVHEALEKRDAEAQRAAETLKDLERSEYVREVIVNEKRKLVAELRQARDEIADLRSRVQPSSQDDLLLKLSAQNADDRWEQIRAITRDHLQALVAHLKGERSQPITPPDRRQTWLQWMEQEQSLVQQVLAPSAFDLDSAPESLVKLESTQQLLAVRWYLMEYTRQAILMALEETDFPV